MDFRNPYRPPDFMPVMRVLVAIGIIIVTIALIFFANEMIGPTSPSWFLQLAAAGAIILVMSFLSIYIFRTLDYV